MDGDWAEVKKTVKKKQPQQAQSSAANVGPAKYGGRAGKNMLVAGAVGRPGGKYGGAA